MLSWPEFDLSSVSVHCSSLNMLLTIINSQQRCPEKVKHPRMYATMYHKSTTAENLHVSVQSAPLSCQPLITIDGTCAGCTIITWDYNLSKYPGPWTSQEGVHFFFVPKSFWFLGCHVALGCRLHDHKIVIRGVVLFPRTWKNATNSPSLPVDWLPRDVW